MAEINQTHATAGSVKVRARKLSTRIDMTPMVDLAFLLLTFFILTSTFYQPQILQLDMPEKVTDPTLLAPVNDENVLNLVLGENNKLYWWIEINPTVQQTNYSADGIRKILLEKGKNRQLMVLIKPAENSRYENIIDMLDELSITNIERYAIVEFTNDDKEKISATVVNTQPHKP